MATLTVYPDADPETSTIDGWVSNSNAVWATAHDAASGDNSDTTSGLDAIITNFSGGTYTIRRLFLLFDTSSLTTAASISSSVISIAARGSASSNADSSDLNIVSSTPASNTNLVLGDYSTLGSSSFASMTVASWVITDGTYNDFTLNGSGISNISLTGISKFGWRIGLDINNVAPTGLNRVFNYMADQAGTSTDPKLVIQYKSVFGDYGHAFQLYSKQGFQ